MDVYMPFWLDDLLYKIYETFNNNNISHNNHNIVYDFMQTGAQEKVVKPGVTTRKENRNKSSKSLMKLQQ